MAASSSAEGKAGRGRKRKRPDIPGFTSSVRSTPSVVSKAPRGIKVEEFAESRAFEIHNMVEAIKAADRSSGKRLFQTLPRHMRRRAMSHNVKRMPARLRYRATLEMKNTGNKTQKTGEGAKKKSRRWRRKPKNLLEEYARRQRKHAWLETHIWHAKRMRMIDTWGYRLADHPNDKGFRACYRAVKNHSFLQDISFHGCIEVIGVQSKIIQAMSHLTSQDAGLTMGAKWYKNGSRQGNVILYKFDQYPYGALGPVSFLWRQKQETESCTPGNAEMKEENVNESKASKRNIANVNGEISERGRDSQLWIWAHPASFQLVFDTITEACCYVGRTSVKRDCKLAVECRRDGVDKPEESVAEESLENSGEHAALSVASRRFDLVKFRLTGPRSHALLASTLTLLQANPSGKIHKESSPCDRDGRVKNTLFSNWWCDTEGVAKTLASNVLWDSLKQASSAAVLPPGCVIGLTVRDPRLDLPVMKLSISDATEEINSEEAFSNEDEAENTLDTKNKKPCFEDILTHWPTDVAGSHIWDEQVRTEVKEAKIPEHELNRKRSELLVPGSRLALSEEEISHIPLLLVQLPGCREDHHGYADFISGYGSGWDIILPAGWAMPFWIALVYRGARAGGLQEAHALALEQGVPFFPNDFPDTPAGEAFNSKLNDDGEARHNRCPPAKRPNYDKLGMKCPYGPPWRDLVDEWSCCVDKSSGERREALKSAKATSVVASKIGDSADQLCSLGGTSKETTSQSAEANVNKGGPQIGGPSVQPLYAMRSQSKLSTLRNFAARCQQRQLSGVNRHKLALDHSTLTCIVNSHQNALVGVFLRMTNRSVPEPNSSVAIPAQKDTSSLVACKSYAGPVEPLQKGSRVQSDKKTLRNSCSREIIGFVSSGHYCFSRGCGCGVAFCALPGLAKLLMSSRSSGGPLVLVRGPGTQQYRFAHFTIL